MRTIHPVLYILAATIAISSCKKFTDVPPPPDIVIAAGVFTTDEKAATAMTSIYGNMINGPQAFCNYLSTTCGGMSADELNKFNATAAEQEIFNNQLTPENGLTRNIWNTAYKQVYYANSILEGITASAYLSGATKNQLRGEALFVRSLGFYYLVGFFGDIPLTLTTDYSYNRQLARKPAAEVYDQLVKDLSEARELLSETYPAAERGRPNKWAVSALLARCYLSMGEWQKAEAASTAIIGSGLYTPLPDLSEAFTKNSREIIWQLVQRTGAISEPRQLRPVSSGRPQFYLTPELRNAFENGDQRKLKWVDSINYQGNKYFFPGKYKLTAANNSEYYVVFRAGEQLLIRAEARLEQHNVERALDDINLLRQRAGLLLLSGLSEADAKKALEQEKRSELFCEWGHRWLDLKRTGRADAVISLVKPSWQSTDVLYPIPQDDMLANPFLTQNTGY